MLLPLTLLLLAGAVSADFDHGWKVGTEYTYLVRSRTLTSLDKTTDQHAGILMKALLTIQAKDTQTLVAKVSKGQYARVHMLLPDGWDTDISDQNLELLDLPIRGTPFEIKLKHGVIRDIVVERDLPTWEVNILKSIVSQLQVDSQGENVIKTKEIQIPTDDEPFGSYKVMEDSVGGKCEVLYDMAPLPNHLIHMKPELVPKPELKGDGHHIDITKTKNFDKCDQRMTYHFGLMENPHWQGESSKSEKLFSIFSTSKIVISGNLKRFTVQSSSTTSTMRIRLRLIDDEEGIVVSRMNLTLGDVQKITNPLPKVNNPESTGNLVYNYENPFSSMQERRINKKIETLGSNAVISDSISSVSSSEETKDKAKQKLRDLFSSASESSSSISNSKENDFWQPKPTLQDAPRIPFLSEFIGSQSKEKGKAAKEKVKELLLNIAYELDNPSTMTSASTLENLSTVCNLLRTLNKDEIFDVENELGTYRDELGQYSDDAMSNKVMEIGQNLWYAFRDVVTQTGTGPAFLLIKKWIENDDVKATETADILMTLPKTVRVPTAEYVRAFFELVKSPKIANDPLLASVSVVAFGKLLHNSQVNSKTIHNRYPVHTFGRLVSKHDQSLLDEYIPFLANGLKNAVEKSDSSSIQSYIVALGTVGHPKILSVFEPYLEGKRPLTTFQKTLMVGSLDNLISTNTKLARSVLYKIYLNTMESHEVRCTAVFLLMKTNPPLSMLQRMAEFTMYDSNKHVNSAVKSTLEDLAKMESPEWQGLAKKAAIASKQLTTRDYDYRYSHGMITEFLDDETKLSTQSVLNYIGSDDSIIPRAMYSAIYSSFSDFKVAPNEILVMISSMRSLMDLAGSLKDTSGKQTGKLQTEKLAEMLNIIPDEPIPVEGNVMINTKLVSKIFPFDGNSIRKLYTAVKEKLLAMKDRKWINEQKFASFDMTLGLPTETGLPFVYDFKLPFLYKVNGEVQGQITPDMMISGKTNLGFTTSMMVQARVGFIAPFEHRHFMAGVDTKFHLYLPLKLDVDANTMKKTVQVKIWPQVMTGNIPVIHYSTVPYTATRDIFSTRPILTEKTTQKVESEETDERETDSGYMNKLMKLGVQGVQSDDLKLVEIELDDMYRNNRLSWTVDNNSKSKNNMHLNTKAGDAKPILLTLSYDTLNMEPDPNVAKKWTSTAAVVEPLSKDPDSEDRRKQMLKEAGKGIKLAKSSVVDIALVFPDEQKNKYILTVAWSDSDAENKGRLLTYGRMESSEKESLEVCSSSQALITPHNIFFNDHISQIKPKAEFDVDIRFGTTCSSGKQINVKGKAAQSKKLQSLIKNSPLVTKCDEQMKQGNKILRACQNVIVRSMLFNEMDITMDIDSEEVIEGLSQMIEGIVSLYELDADVEAVDPKNAGKKKINIVGKLSDDFQAVSLHVHMPSMDIRIDDADISDLEIVPEDILESADDEIDLASLVYLDDRFFAASCMLDKTKVETFDGESYPLRLDNCWHVVMTTYPRLNPEKPGEKLKIPKSKSVSVLSRETEDGKKEVKILLGEDQIKLLPNESLLQVKVNGKVVEVSEDMSYQKKEEDKVMVEIYKVGNKAVGLSSDEFDTGLIFDGERIMILATDDYRNSIRGLCGNFDGEQFNDFTGPQNCMFRNSEKFIASYALIKDKCEGHSLEVAKSILKHVDCIPVEKKRHSNVINDFESGRLTTDVENWGYHAQGKTGEKRCAKSRTEVREVNGKVCFSTRPVISCEPGCSATETKSKNYQFHCMDRNNWSLSMKRRIENGANPDLSQKRVDMSQAIVVPLACTA